MENQLILGDNFDILRKMDSESVDLIYLDPPFFSNRNYEVIWGDEGEVRSFRDRWSGGIDHYIGWLKERVEEMHRILKPTGSIFLHCDWHADAFIQVYILEKLFGSENFKNKIIWKRTDTHNDAKHQLPMVCDYIFYYSKSSKFTFHPQHTDYPRKTLEDWYLHLELPDGSTRKMTEEERLFQKIPKGARRFNMGDMASPNPRPNLMYEYKGYSHPPKGWRYSEDSMKKLDDNGELLFPSKKSGRIMRKRYLDEQKGPVLGDLWDDISMLRSRDPERIGYPTQKPEALMERIIEMASNEGDVVLDPFVGGGTTVAVADRLKRKWVGIDQSVQAVKVTEMRLALQKDLFSAPFSITLHKYDYDTIFNMDPYKFEQWIIEQYGGEPNTKQRGDFGTDGRTLEGTPIQVKQSEGIGRNVVDNFFSAAKRYDKRRFEKNKKDGQPVGYVIAFSFGKGAVQEVARLKLEEGVEIELVEVASIVEFAKKPLVEITYEHLGATKKGAHKIKLMASAQSDAGIEFFSWQWQHEPGKGFLPDVLLDKKGEQTEKFKAGTYNVAVKAVDNDGLETIELLKLKVNGAVKLMK